MIRRTPRATRTYTRFPYTTLFRSVRLRDSHSFGAVRRCGMRTGIEIEVTAPDTKRLEAIVAARGSPQKHVWRARIILLTARGLGTQAIMMATGKSKTCVWRWQERFMAEGVDGRSEENKSELQSLMRNSYAVFCLKKKKPKMTIQHA